MTASLPALVSLVGVVVAGIGLLGITAPAHLKRLLGRRRVLVGLPVTLGIRLVVGVVFVFAAPECRLPTLVRLIGFIELGGALVLIGLGAPRLERFADSWLQRSSAFVRYWCVGALAFGMVLLYAGA